MKNKIITIFNLVLALIAFGSCKSMANTNNILAIMDANFTRESLKSIHIKYRYEIVGGKHPRSFEKLLVAESNSYYIVKQYDFKKETDDRIDPPIVITNYNPFATYEWCDGDNKVIGGANPSPSYGWRIEKPDGVSWFSSFYSCFNLLDWKPSESYRVINQRTMTNGVVVYTCSSKTDTKPIAEYTFSSTDGNGVAPIKSVMLIPDGSKYVCEWSGWKKYGDIWIPSTFKENPFMSYCDAEGGQQLEQEIHIFTLIDVISVNEPISPRWFMPQFPARKLKITDMTGETKRRFTNFDYEGNSYQ